MTDIVERLSALRGTLHVNELRHSGTRDGNLYSEWGATVAFALIEIERLRSPTQGEELETVYSLIRHEASWDGNDACREVACRVVNALSKIDGAASEDADLAFGRALHLIDRLLKAQGTYDRNTAIEFLNEHKFKRHCR